MSTVAYKSTTLTDRIESATTIANARQYEREQDQFVFCLNLLDLSAWDSVADYAVNTLEDRFDRINLGQATGYELLAPELREELNNLTERLNHQGTMKFSDQDQVRLGFLEQMVKQLQADMDAIRSDK